MDLLFPPRCVGCGREGEFLCVLCRHSLPRLDGALCPKCSQPFQKGGVCSPCQRWPLAIDGIRSPYRFEGVMRQAILGLKYQNLKVLSTPLAELLAHYWQSCPLPGEVLVPVPLHPRRLRERGYNQAALLARALGERIGLPVEETSLRRYRAAPSQARAASAEERRANVAGAFLCPPSSLEGKRVVLVDDVCTTGATLDAAARALKAAGARSVWGLTLAREL